MALESLQKRKVIDMASLSKVITQGELGGLLKKHGRLVAELPYVNGGKEFLVMYGQSYDCWFTYQLVMNVSVMGEPEWSQHRLYQKTWENHTELVSDNASEYCCYRWYAPEFYGISIPLPTGKPNKKSEKSEKKARKSLKNDPTVLRAKALILANYEKRVKELADANKV